MAEAEGDAGSGSGSSAELCTAMQAAAISAAEQPDSTEDTEENIDPSELEKIFKYLQSPINWGLPEFNEAKMLMHINRIRDLLLVPHSSWGTVVLRFTLCWLYYKHGDLARSRAELAEIHSMLRVHEGGGGGGGGGGGEAEGGGGGEEGALLQRCLSGVEHVLHAAWAHLAHRSTPLEAMGPELLQIATFKELSPQQQSAVYGLQASCRYCFFEWVGFRMKAAALRAQELYPREPEWLRVYGDQPAALQGDAFTPHIAVYCATWHLQKKRADPARELLRRALAAWPDNAFVHLNAAVMFGRDKSVIRDLDQAGACAEAAVRLAPNCVIANLVRRMVVPTHNAPCLALCEITYGKGVLAILPFLGAGNFSLEVIMRGFFMR